VIEFRNGKGIIVDNTPLKVRRSSLVSTLSV
jgi:hypothetical protein